MSFSLLAMTTENILEPQTICSDNVPSDVTSQPIQVVHTVIDESKTEPEHRLLDMPPKSSTAPLQPSVIKTKPETPVERKPVNPAPTSPLTEKPSEKPTKLHASKTDQGSSDAPSRASRPLSGSKIHHGEKRSVERKTAKNTGTTKTRSRKVLLIGTKDDQEGLLPRPSSVFEDQGLEHTSHGRKTILRPGEKSSIVSRRSKQSQTRATKYIRPVDSPLRRRPRTLLTSPSLASLISTFTTLTTSSSGSNSTVTPQSLTTSSSSHRNDKQAEPTRAEKRDPEVAKDQPADEPIDVFSFLESDVLEDQSGWRSSSTASDSDDYFSEAEAYIEPRPLSPSAAQHHIDHPPTSWREHETVHSDSGISMGESSPELGRAKLHQEQPAIEPVLNSEVKETTSPSVNHSRKNNGRVQKLRFCDQQLPVTQDPALQNPSISLRMLAPPPPPPPAPAGPLYLPRINTSSLPDPVGYGLLATKLSAPPRTVEAEHEDRPLSLYRRFEPLNHRVMLHLQDELAELEDHLCFMDDLIARQSHEVAAFSASAPRADSRQGSALHEQRTEILGRVFLKLNQYNQFLASYKASSGLESASKEDATSYRNWLRKQSPIIEAETRFLDRDSDLIRVVSKKEQSQSLSQKVIAAARRSSNQPRYSQLIPPAVLMLTLIVFAAVKGVAGRLLLLCVVAGGGSVALWWMEPEVGRDLLGQGAVSAGLCAGALVVCAVALV